MTFFLRDDAEWLLACAGGDADAVNKASLSHPAREVLASIEDRGASVFNDLTRASKRLASEVEGALWELVAAGLVTADGFENLRSLLDPKRRRGEGRGRTARPRHAAGRWALLRETIGVQHDEEEAASRPEANSDSLEAFARQLLARWGVVFRDIARRESLAPPWRELLGVFRRMEARGEIRGGRFAQAFIGEQFALPEALELLRSVRRSEPSGEVGKKFSEGDKTRKSDTELDIEETVAEFRSLLAAGAPKKIMMASPTNLSIVAPCRSARAVISERYSFNSADRSSGSIRSAVTAKSSMSEKKSVSRRRSWRSSEAWLPARTCSTSWLAT
jgi:hypothetical protein